jgi:hypothetical protein
MKEKKPFLIPEITLATLAEEMKVTPEYLSGILNSNLGKKIATVRNKPAGTADWQAGVRLGLGPVRRRTVLH